MKEFEKYITDEKTGLKYELVGDYYYPCLKAPEAPKVGRFGMVFSSGFRPRFPQAGEPAGLRRIRGKRVPVPSGHKY